MLTTRSRLAPKLRMNGAIPLLPQCAFMVWAGTALLFMENKGSFTLSRTAEFLLINLNICINVYIVVFLFNTVIYVFLLLCLCTRIIVCLCILIVPTGSLPLP